MEQLSDDLNDGESSMCSTVDYHPPEPEVEVEEEEPEPVEPEACFTDSRPACKTANDPTSHTSDLILNLSSSQTV